jgi:hypothetical protein
MAAWVRRTMEASAPGRHDMRAVTSQQQCHRQDGATEPQQQQQQQQPDSSSRSSSKVTCRVQ